MLEDEIALLLDRLIRHAHSKLHQRASLLHEEGLQPTDGMLMTALASIEPAPIRALVERVARHKSQVTRTVQKLEAKGLIDVSELQSDGRVRLLKLSARGRQVADEIRNNIGETLHELLGPLSKPDRKTLRDLLERALNS